MKLECISRNGIDIFREIIVSVVATIILVAGWKLDTSGLMLIEIEPDRVLSLCTVIISAQIAFLGIAYSLITINSSFQNSQKFGIDITDYLIRKKYLVLNQRNILFLEVLILVASIVCMVFELFYSVCSFFVCFLLLLVNISIDVFNLYRNDVVEEKMFIFLKKNFHNKKLNLLEKYSESERSWLKTNENFGRKPTGRLEELWLNELDFIDNDKYEESHNVFVSLINAYISSADEFFQDYGLGIAKNIIKKINKLKQPKPQVNEFGQILDKNTNYGVELFYTIIPRVSELFYSRTNSSPVYDLINLMVHFDEGKSKYSHNTSLNSFFNCIVSEPESEMVNDRLKSLFEYFFVCSSEESPETMELSTTVLIHLFVKAIRAGKIRVVEHELFSNMYVMSDNKHNRMLSATVICYLYYIAYCETDDRISYYSRGSIISQNVREVLERNCSGILDLFSSMSLNKEFSTEIHNWLSDYELIKGSNEDTKLSIIDYSIDKCLILYKTLASPINIDLWLPDFVSDVWSSYYDIISSKSFSDDFMEIGKICYGSDDKFIESIISDLRDSLSNIAVNLEMLHSNSISDGELEEYLNSGIASFKDTVSFGKIEANSEKSHIKFYIPYKKYHLNKHLADMYLHALVKDCHKQILYTLYGKVDKEEIRNILDIEYYLDRVKSCDIHYGKFPVMICKDNHELSMKLHEVFSRGQASFLSDKTVKICFDADSESFGLKVDNMNVHIRKLNDEERSLFYPLMVESKHKTKLLNEMEVLLKDDEFRAYIDSRDRIIQVDFDVIVSAKTGAGFCSRFHETANQ